MVASRVAAVLGGFEQLFHFEAGEVLAVAVLGPSPFLPTARRALFSCFPPVHHFVEGSSKRAIGKGD
jgi:hypothetical protein